MASLKKEEIEMAAAVAAAKLDTNATIAWTTVQQLLSKIHMT
jgi:hypothetical protein